MGNNGEISLLVGGLFHLIYHWFLGPTLGLGGDSLGLAGWKSNPPKRLVKSKGILIQSTQNAGGFLIAGFLVFFFMEFLGINLGVFCPENWGRVMKQQPFFFSSSVAGGIMMIRSSRRSQRWTNGSQD